MPAIAIACLLSQRGVLRVSGEDRTAFLQSLISNDMALCKPDRPLYAALLTPQGKFLYDLFVYNNDGAYLIDCENAGAESLLHQLKIYTLRAKVELSLVSDAYEVWAFPHGAIGNLDPRLPELGSRGIFPKSYKAADHNVTDSKKYDRRRLALGVPEGARDMISGKSTLSDGNFDLLNAISWTKGCYVGQELTARMHHRALVKKRMFPVRIVGNTPDAGTPILFKDNEIGEMRSSQGDIGLALLNIEQVKHVLATNENLMCSEAKLTPSIPEWLKAAI